MPVFIDIKYAFRLLFKAPKFTAMTLSVLVGGLSLSLFTFSFLYTVMYKDLPLPEGETALAVTTTFLNDESVLMSSYEFAQLKEQQTVLAEFGAIEKNDIRLSFEDSGTNIYSAYVDEGFFKFSRVKPLMGRTIQKVDTLVGATPVAVISHHVWQNELSARKNILGSTIVANDIVTEVIGVMPPGFRMPGAQKMWLPLSQEVLNRPADTSQIIYVYGRLKEDVSKEKAERVLSQTLNATYQQNVALYDFEEGTKTIELVSFPVAQMGGDSTVIFVFLNTIASMILLLACINVGNLLLARSIERQKETAIRAALGASNKRLVSQLMWEGILITTLGGVLSLLLVGAALHYTDIFLHSELPNGLMFWWKWGMDIPTFLMAIVFTLVTIFLSAFLPAWRSANQDINTTLRDGTRGAQGKKAGRLTRFLVTTQVFIVALLMLLGSITAFISHKFVNIDMGDDYSNVMTARFNLQEDKYPEDQQKIAFFHNIMERINAHPKVEGVTLNNWLGELPLTLDGEDNGSEENQNLADVLSVIGDTDTIGVNLVSGRFFTHQDKAGNRKVAIISQSMANRFWPGENVLGKSISVDMSNANGAENERLFIVGVVTDRLNPRTLIANLDSADEIYVSGLQFVDSFQILYYRIIGDLAKTEEIFYQALYQVDRSIELYYAVQPAEKNRGMMRKIMKLTSNLTFSTGFFSLMLALVGIYGLTANSVSQRTHEIGIRRAVGASDKNIIHMFLKQGGMQLAKGLGLALVLFSILAYGFIKMSEGIFPTSLYLALALTVTVGLSCIVMVAIYVPTRRSVIMEPSSALRYE